MPESQIYLASATLNDAQIKSLPTSPIVIAPPTEVLNYSGTPTHLLTPLLAVVRTVTHAGDYANINADCYFGIDIGSDDSFSYSVRTQSNGASVLLNNAGGVSFFTPRLTSIGAAPVVTGTNNLTDALLDNAIVFFAFNQGDGNFTGGDSTNEMKVTVLYVAIDI